MAFRKICCTIALISIAGFLYGQETKSIHLGFSLNPKILLGAYERSEYIESKNPLNISARLDLYFDLTSRIQLKSGLSYSFIKLNHKDFNLLFRCDLGFNGGEYFNSWYQDDFTAHDIGIPLELKIKFSENKNHLYLKGGTGINFKLEDKKHTEIFACGEEEGMVVGNSNIIIRKFAVALNAGVGYEFSLGKKSKVIIEPNLSFYLSKFYAGNEPILRSNLNVLQFGTMIGLVF